MSSSEPNHNPNLDSVKDVNSKRSTSKLKGGSNTCNNGGFAETIIPLPSRGKKFPPIPQSRPQSQTFDSVESVPKGRSRAPQLSAIIGGSKDGSPRHGLYFKNPSTNSLGNGSVSAANANGRSQKVRRQNSLGTFGLQRVPSFVSDTLDENDFRPTVLADPEKIEAAKKRLLEAKLKKAKNQTVASKNWKQRFKWCGTTLVTLTIILSSSSLLFVVPIVVDPILVGFDAQFSSKPVQCRTVSFENETGPMNCVMPSCREGCTADLYACIFVSVVYTKETLSITTGGTFGNSSLHEDTSPLLPTSISDHNENVHFINGTLFVNPGGCGYPPDVNCSIFEKKFREIGTMFPCYYSSINSSLVVPFYSRHEELINLSVALGIPFGLLFVASAGLFLLLRWDLNRVQDITQDEDIGDEDLEAWRLSNSESSEILNIANSKKNGKTSNNRSKFNGHGPGVGHFARDNFSRSRSLDSSSAIQCLQSDDIGKTYSKNNLINGVAGMSYA